MSAGSTPAGGGASVPRGVARASGQPEGGASAPRGVARASGPAGGDVSAPRAASRGSGPTSGGPGGRRGFWERLPEPLRPREQEHEPRGRGDLRRVESTLLALALVLLAVAVVNDVVLSTHTAQRITADLRTWRTLTGRDYHNISVEQDLQTHTTRDILCGNDSPGPPGTLPQICLVITGPTVRGVREAHGGFYLPPQTPDKRAHRYACFGSALRDGLCGAATPAGAPHAPIPGADG